MLEYNNCKATIRRLVNKRKRAEYQAYLHDLEIKDNAKAIEQLARINDLGKGEPVETR